MDTQVLETRDPRRIYKLIKRGREEEAVVVLKTIFHESPEWFGWIVRDIHELIRKAAKNQKLSNQPRTAEKFWLPDFLKLVEDITGFPAETFIEV